MFPFYSCNFIRFACIPFEEKCHREQFARDYLATPSKCRIISVYNFRIFWGYCILFVARTFSVLPFLRVVRSFSKAKSVFIWAFMSCHLKMRFSIGNEIKRVLWLIRKWNKKKKYNETRDGFLHTNPLFSGELGLPRASSLKLDKI